MMTLKLYANCKILPNKNFIVEDIDYYLNSLYSVSHELSFAKLEYETEVVAPTDDTYLEQFKDGLDAFNYVSITFENEVSGHIITYYYFIEDIKWSSQLGLYLKLKMDILNTYKEDVDFKLSHKCQIHRRHFDRIKEYQGDSQYEFKVHRLSEGLSIPLIKKTESNILQRGNQMVGGPTWYLMFKSKSDEDSAINMYLVPSIRLKVSGNSNIYELEPLDSPSNQGLYQIAFEQNGYEALTAFYTKAGVRTAISNPRNIQIIIDDNNSMHLYYTTADDNSVQTIENISKFDSGNVQLVYYNPLRRITTLPDLMNDGYPIKENTLHMGYTRYLKSIDEIDRTDGLIQQIIKLPYCPINFEYLNQVIDVTSEGINLSEDGVIFTNEGISLPNSTDRLGYIKIYDLTKEFSSSLALPSSLNLTKTQLLYKTITHESALHLSKFNVKQYETKLLHSDYFHSKFVYDQFNIILKSELNQFPDSITFKASNTGNSNFLFKINMTDADYESDYPMYVLTNKNTNIPLFTSAYLNYIRTGYNYDLQSKKNSEVASWISGILGIGGAAVGLVAGGPIGIAAAAMFAVGTGQSLTQNITQVIQNENTMKSKLAQSALQGFEISGSNDVDLYTTYTENRAKFVQYQVDEHFVDQLFNIFYYTGYCSNEIMKPTHNTRISFDYLESTIDFDEVGRIPLEVITLFKEKFLQGVYYLHKNYFSYTLPDGTSYQSEYDFELLNDNLERTFHFN